MFRFQWAALQIAQLIKLQRDSDIRARLGQLPLGLQTAYDELNQQIQGQDGSGGKVAERAIKWVMCSRRPLTTEELLGAVCQSPDDHDAVSPIDVDADFVLNACRNLLVIDPNARVWKFAHLSVQEYFESLHRVRRQHEWSYSSAHAMAAKVCLLLLNDPALDADRACTCHDSSRVGTSGMFEAFADSAAEIRSLSADENNVSQAAGDVSDDAATEEFEGLCLCPIRNYARTSWAYHLQGHGEEHIDSRVTALLQQFLGSMNDSGQPYRNWLERESRPKYEAALYLPKGRQSIYPSDVRPASVASLAICRLGLYKVLGDWWEAGFRDVHVRNEVGMTLLMLAVAAGNIDVVTRLINSGAA